MNQFILIVQGDIMARLEQTPSRCSWEIVFTKMGLTTRKQNASSHNCHQHNCVNCDYHNQSCLPAPAQKKSMLRTLQCQFFVFILDMPCTKSSATSRGTLSGPRIILITVRKQATPGCHILIYWLTYGTVCYELAAAWGPISTDQTHVKPKLCRASRLLT